MDNKVMDDKVMDDKVMDDKVMDNKVMGNRVMGNRVIGDPVVGDTDTAEIRRQVRRRYATAAVSPGSGCCGTDGCCGAGDGRGATSIGADLTGGLYSADEVATIPGAAVNASLGCGNPTAVAELREGETVLDLGSGGGIDVLLSAQRVGPSGRAIGLDMTDEMLDLARRNAADAGATNVEFHKGYMEDMPLDDASVDVVISNCVVNLSADKPAVFTEIYRVLRPGGRIGISDIVADDALSPTERAERGDWVGCIAGALSQREYRQGLTDAGFAEVSLTATHAVADGMDSMIIRAVKP